MRTSQKVLLSAACIVAMTLIIAVIYARVAVSGLVQEGNEIILQDLGDNVTVTRDLRDFHGVVIKGGWEIHMQQGDTWQVEVSYPQNVADYMDVHVNREHLVLNVRDMKTHKDLDLKAVITMPALEYLEVAGAGKIEFSGFNGEKIKVDLSGAASIEGNDGRYEQLELDLKGAGHVGLKDIVLHDADINLAGAGNVELTMDGGVLSGNLAGVGRVRYHGDIRENRIGIFGVGTVKKAD